MMIPNRTRWMLTALCVLLALLMPACALGESTAQLPIVSEPVTLTYWVGLGAKVSEIATNWNEIECWKELEKRTGVHIEFIHPPLGQEAEQIKLMFATGDYPDIVAYSWKEYIGGIDQAKADGVLLSNLTELLNEHAPNFLQMMENNPERRLQIVDDEGDYYAFPEWREWDVANSYYGFMLRKDWLDKLGLSVPTTVDEWHDVLVAFRDGDPNGNGLADEIPFTCAKPGVFNQSFRNFKMAFGLSSRIASVGSSALDYYVEDGQVKYGPLEPGYKEYIETMRQWYAEGLIDKEYPTRDASQYAALMTSDVGGATFAGAGFGFMGAWTKVMREKGHETFELVGAPYPKAADGTTPSVADIFVDGATIAITGNCKDPVTAVKWFDYVYSPEGHMLLNYGPEGMAYEMVDGEPRFTDVIVNNPDGLNLDSALLHYGMAPWGGPYTQDKQYWVQTLDAYPELLAACEVWAQGDTSKMLPPVNRSGDEAATFANIMSEVTTYVGEMEDKFIMGIEPMENYGAFLDTLQKMNIAGALEIQQKAYERYLSR